MPEHSKWTHVQHNLEARNTTITVCVEGVEALTNKLN